VIRSSSYQTSKLTAIAQWKGIAPLTEVVAFVQTSFRCSRKRVNVTARPKTQSINESLVKVGKEEIRIIKKFALQITGL